jgi:hypothetical protein
MQYFVPKEFRMGIFSKPSQTSAYVPPASTSTLLGDSAQPAAGQYDDLNRLPATTVELRFRRVNLGGYDTGKDHAFIVVTDNVMGKQWVNQAGPWRAAQKGTFGFVDASSEEYKKDESRDYDAPYKTAGRFSTDASADSVAHKLEGFANRFNENGVPYELPTAQLPMVPPGVAEHTSTLNSNYYGGTAWQHLTGSVPSLPIGINAPGWGDHLREPYGAIP